MNLRIWTMLMTALACASVAAARSSSASPSTLFALSTLQNPPPVAQPPRVPGEPPRPPQSPPVSRQPESPKNDQITVAGCIEQGQAQASTKEPSATGTSGTSGQSQRNVKGQQVHPDEPEVAGSVCRSPEPLDFVKFSGVGRHVSARRARQQAESPCRPSGGSDWID